MTEEERKQLEEDGYFGEEGVAPVRRGRAKIKADLEEKEYSSSESE